MAQANVSRARAVRALRDNQSDIVNAIMVSGWLLLGPPAAGPTGPLPSLPSLSAFPAGAHHVAADRHLTARLRPCPPALLLNKGVSPHGLCSRSYLPGRLLRPHGICEGVETLPGSVKSPRRTGSSLPHPQGWGSVPRVLKGRRSYLLMFQRWWPAPGPRGWMFSPWVPEDGVCPMSPESGSPLPTMSPEGRALSPCVPRGWDLSWDSSSWGSVLPPRPRCPTCPEMVGSHLAVAQGVGLGPGLGKEVPRLRGSRGLATERCLLGRQRLAPKVLGPPGTQLWSGHPSSPRSLFSKSRDA